MHKIFLITAREYITRVKNKTFLLTTFLTPLGILLFIVAASFIMTRGSDSDKYIVVLDKSNLLQKTLDAGEHLKFNYVDEDLNSLKEDVKSNKYFGVLEIQPLTDSLAESYSILFHSDQQLAIDESSAIKRSIENKIREYKLKTLQINPEILQKINTKISIEPKTINEEKSMTNLTTVVSSAIGGVVGYAMFFIILLYGVQVMRSVMEEKINRIVEVLISSVKPFQLMMGKVIGVGLVGLTQILLWMILIPIVVFIGSAIFGLNPEDISQTTNIKGMQAIDQAQTMQFANQIMMELKEINWYYLIPMYLFYFIGGYFAYAALFAAVGSAVGEDINESNSLTMPIMLPLIMAMYIGMAAVTAPDSSVAVWASMIPLLSSVVMPVRLPFNPPWWQVGLSVVLLIVFTIFLVWIASKIYRTGILMYGKKASIKEIVKWLRS